MVDLKPYVNIFIQQPGIFTATHCSFRQTKDQAKATGDFDQTSLETVQTQFGQGWKGNKWPAAIFPYAIYSSQVC